MSFRKVTLRFGEPMETEFRDHNPDALLRPIRALLGIVTALGVLETFFWFFFLGHELDGSRLALFGIFSIAGAIFAATYRKNVHRHAEKICFALVPVFVVLAAVYVNFSSPDRRIAIAGFYFIMLLISTSLPCTHILKHLMNASLFATSLAFPPPTTTFKASSMVIIQMGFGVFIASMLAYVMEMLRRDAFLSYRRSEQLLLNTLPASVAARLKAKDGDDVLVDKFDQAVVVFADLVGFTKMAAELPAEEIVRMLNGLFSRFDALAERHGLEKIKTIGDAYMVVAGVPEAHPDGLAAAVDAANDMLVEVEHFAHVIERPLAMRVGVHAGPVVAGVIGRKKFLYDLWGDTVNTASRLETSGEPGRVHMLASVARQLPARFRVEPRGEVRL
jgi:class 3 adenylate cyclase